MRTKTSIISFIIVILFFAAFVCLFLPYSFSWIPGALFIICSILWGINCIKALTDQVDSLDKKLSSNIKEQLSLLFSVVSIFFLLFIGIILCFQPDFSEVKNDTSFSSFIHLAHRYIGYNYYDDNPILNSGVLLLSLFGTLLLGGLLITTFSNIVQQRKNDFLLGYADYGKKKKLQGHYIFLGFNDYSVQLCRELLSNSTSRTVILTNQNINDVRSILKSRLTSDLYERILIFSGDIDDEDNLKRLNINACKEVYILGENEAYGHDSICLTTTKKICSILDDKRKQLLKIYLQIDSPSAFSITQKLDVPLSYTSIKKEDGIHKLIDLHLFNPYENQARKLWGYYKESGSWDLDYSDISGPKLLPDSSNRVNLVIAGFDRMGQALLLEALRICHFPNYSEEKNAIKTIITVLDKNMDEIWPQFEARYPHLAEIEDIEIKHYSEALESPNIRKLLEDYASKKEELMTIAICFWDPDNSFSSGLSLPESLYFNVKNNKGHNNEHVRILIRNEFNAGIKDVISADSARYKNVRFFGSVEDGLSELLLDDKAAILQGAHFDTVYKPLSPQKKEIYNKYISLINQRKKQQETYENGISILTAYQNKYIDANEALDLARLFWNETSENHKCSNRYQIEMYGIYNLYLASLNKKYKKKTEIILSQMEHRRWCAERYIMGYRYENYKPNTIIKDEKDLWRVHNDLVPFSKLSNQEKAKDLVHLTIDTINNIINELSNSPN